MEVSFVPSTDVAVVLNALLDILERRAHPNEIRNTEHNPDTHNALRSVQVRPLPFDTVSERRTVRTPLDHRTRSIKLTFADIPLPNYFSQTDPTPRILANEQLTQLEKNGLLKLVWIPGETGHLLQSITLQTEHGTRVSTPALHRTHCGASVREERYSTTNLTEHAPRNTPHQILYHLTNRTPLATNRSRLESYLLAEKFRFVDDWRARSISYILNQLKAGKSPAPFSLTDSNLTLDLLAVLQALSTLTAETPYRVFSVRVFNDSKRLEAIKNQLVTLARLGNPEWKRIPAEEVLRELNLVANPNYVHFAGDWQLTTAEGEILSLGGFTPSVGFPAAQTSQLQAVQAKSVLCIENLTTFFEYIRQRENGNKYTSKQVDTQTSNHTQPNGTRTTQLHASRERSRRNAILCTYGNPSPAVRRVLRLLPETTPILLWSDMDYGGFNILSQLRRFVSEHVQPYLMNIDTLESNIPRARPLTASDIIHLKRLLLRPELRDVHPVIVHLLKRGLKLEQEGVENF